MPFELLTRTEATLTTFTGRVETHGKSKLPAVSIRLRFSGPNTLLDLLSPTARKTFYMAEPGQEDLPGVEPTTPLLRSKDIKHWSPETSHEGWTVDRTGNEEDDIELGGSKIDGFTCDLFENPARVEIECRIGTHHLSPDQAGFLWSKQQQKVFVMLAAPLTQQTNPDAGKEADPNQLTLDGSTGGAISEPSAARAAAEAEFSGGAKRGDDWPFPRNGDVAFDGAIDGDDDTQDAGEHLAGDVDKHGAEPTAKTPAQIKRESRFPSQGAKYRDPASGQTWSGRGLKPKWLSVALASGKTLADFETVKAH